MEPRDSEAPAPAGPPGSIAAGSSARDDLLRRVVDWFSANGIGDTSLRTLADGIDSSHRMLHYHFGSREGLLADVVGEVWRRHRTAFDGLLGEATDPVASAWLFWTRLADQVDLAALYFEVSAAAMQGHAWAAEPVRIHLAEWTAVLTDFFEQLGNPHEQAELVALTSMAVTRGTLEFLALRGDRDAADRVMRGFLTSLERGPSEASAVDQLP